MLTPRPPAPGGPPSERRTEVKHSSTPNCDPVNDRSVHPDSGTIELRSGLWKWTVHVDGGEAAIIFHAEMSSNRMRSRRIDADTSPNAILKAAREPERRWWADPVGDVWEMRVRPAPSVRLEQRARRRQRIIFSRDGREIETELPEGRTLGELSTVELAALLYESMEG